MLGVLAPAFPLSMLGQDSRGQSPADAQTQSRLIEVIAGHDSRYKIPGQEKPVITVKAGESIRLRVTAIKAKNENRDGSVHGFSLLRAKDQSPVPDWDLLLQPGTQEFLLTAPAEPGEYEVVCTVICSANHEHMNMRFVVVPNGG
jgi:heme/copper-type cytochrome/quinol oxidase subunit 2